MFFFRRKRAEPTIVPREEHTISRKHIDGDALKVLYRLSEHHHEAYLVGGSVRDLLLGRTPKDFDVGTDARPNEIRREFRNCFLVGRRFRLAHIVFGKKVIETATFRKAPDAHAVPDEHGLYQAEDNTFGTPEEDARRRDFTVNGLFYDIKTFAIIDYVGGLKDLKAKVIRSIGDPAIRFREDPVRMMRAVRFAAKLGFEICPADEKAMRRYAPELANASVSRLCEEIQRLFVRGAAERSLRLAFTYGLLRVLLPELDGWLRASSAHEKAVWASLRALDEVAREQEVSAAVSLAALYWPLMAEVLAGGRSGAGGGNERSWRRQVAERAMHEIIRKYRLPRAVWMTAADMLEVAPRFEVAPRESGMRDSRFVNHVLFPELFAGAQVLARMGAIAGGQLPVWEAFYRERGPLARLPEGEELPTRANPHRRPVRRRARRRRGKGAEAAAPEAGGCKQVKGGA